MFRITSSNGPTQAPSLPAFCTTMVPNGSEFAHRSWIRFLYFFLSTKYSRNFSGYYCICILNVLKTIQGDSITRYNCQTIAGVVNWAFPVHMLTQDSKLHPEDPKKFMGHGIAPIYVGIHFFCISRKICKCVEGWSVPLSILSQSRRVTLSEMLSTALADLPENASKVYAYVYRCYPMSHEFFRVFRVQFGVLSQHMYRERPIHHPGSPRLLSGNCISWWDPFVYFLSHPEYIYNSIPKNSESIW